MKNARNMILAWAEQGLIAEADLPLALKQFEVIPSRKGWQHFLDQMLLWMGVVLVAAALVFFLAYNWNALGRFTKFALVESLVLIALLVAWQQGLERPSGKAALLGASLFLGALLALIGQTYQTGADTFELFGTWALMILPWVLLGCYAALWLLWLALVNVAITLYFQAFPSVFGLLFSTERVLWVLFAFNTAALASWEFAAARGVTWLKPRWAPRLLATASGSAITMLAMMQIFDDGKPSLFAIPIWLAWLAAAWTVYYRYWRDIFVLAGGVFSIVLVVASFFIHHLSHRDAGGFLLVGLIVITFSAAGGWWLKKVAAEEAQ